MIAKLTGKIIDLRGDYLVLDVNGVGYKVENNAPFRLGREGQDVDLEIHTLLNDRGIRLFGFSQKAEIKLFEKLLQVSGVGPKSAMLLVSTFSVRQIKQAVESGKPEALKVKGLGKKTLAKIAIELKGKLEDISVSGAEQGVDSEEVAEVGLDQGELSSDLKEALESLGYRPKEFDKIADKIDATKSFSDQVKQALSLLK